jgi:hypothetical protein
MTASRIPAAIEETVSVRATYCTPMLQVMAIARSLAFYELFWFSHCGYGWRRTLGWASMHCEGGALMFLRGEHAVDPAAQGIMLYMYAPI